MDPTTIESWKLDRLRTHPENGLIFGDPEEAPKYSDILASIRQFGIWEPLVAKKNGTLLAGHLRLACARALRMADVPVRVVDDFGSYLDEVRFLIRNNTDRRQLSPMEVGLAMKRLKEIPRAEGGAKAKHGGARSKGKKQAAESSGLETRDTAAEQVGVPRNVAEACETVFTTPGVPEVLKKAVNDGRVAPTRAATEIRAELKRQGGELKTGAALAIVAERKKTPEKAAEPSHADRVAQQAAAYQAAFAKLVQAYRDIDGVLTRTPLKSLIGPTEHHEYGGIVRDIALRAWREVESVEGPTTTGKQMALGVIQGGRT